MATTLVAVDQDPLTGRPDRSEDQAGKTSARPQVGGVRWRLPYDRSEGHGSVELFVDGPGPEEAVVPRLGQDGSQSQGHVAGEGRRPRSPRWRGPVPVAGAVLAAPGTHCQNQGAQIQGAQIQEVPIRS
jgi:hypothetical protein